MLAVRVFGVPTRLRFRGQHAGSVILIPFALLAMFAASFIARLPDEFQTLAGLFQPGADWVYAAGDRPAERDRGDRRRWSICSTTVSQRRRCSWARASSSLRCGSTFFDDIKGLGKIMPWTSAAVVIAGLSLIGVPGTAGFISKWVLVQGALERGWWWIAVLIVASSSAGGDLCLARGRGAVSGRAKGACEPFRGTVDDDRAAVDHGAGLHLLRAEYRPDDRCCKRRRRSAVRRARPVWKRGAQMDTNTAILLSILIPSLATGTNLMFRHNPNLRDGLTLTAAVLTFLCGVDRSVQRRQWHDRGNCACSTVLPGLDLAFNGRTAGPAVRADRQRIVDPDASVRHRLHARE